MDKAAKWPKLNFTEVVKKELAKEEFDCLVMTAPTVDITNIDTSKVKQSDNTTVYQQKVMISCQNMMNAAHNSLKEHPNLKKVVIFEHPPRFDAEEIDPIGLKPALAKYGNNVLNQLWLDSSFKNKISIGSHSLEINSTDVAQNDLFKHPKFGTNDGVHHYGKLGKQSYTKSIRNSLQKSLPQNQQPNVSQKFQQPQSYHQKCPQAVNKNMQKGNNVTNPTYHPSVQVKNRFSVFNSKNL